MNFENRIKAMTLNTQCWNVTPERLVNLPIMVRNYMPDVLGVQEATPKWIETLTEALPEYAYVGVGREADLRGEHSAIFYRKDIFELLASDTKWLSDTPEVPGSKFEDSGWVRIATYAILRRKSDGLCFLHINTHLDTAKMSCKQIAVLLSLLRGWNPENLPVLQTGDFNFQPETRNYQMYIDDGFVNSMLVSDEVSEKTDDTPFPRTTLDGWKFDYLFLKAPEFHVYRHRVCTEQINGAYISDHYPVYMEFSLN